MVNGIGSGHGIVGGQGKAKSEFKRKGILLFINRINSECKRNSFYLRAPVVWNLLGRTTTTLIKLESFKTALKRHKKPVEKSVNCVIF